MADQFGYDTDIFTQKVDDQFECPICSNVCRKPKECRNCGSLFCSSCMNQWLKRSSLCPKAKCDIKKNPLRDIGGALLKMYNNLEVKCDLDNCGKVMNLIDLDSHQLKCQQKKCKNTKHCETVIKDSDSDYCSSHCEMFIKLAAMTNEREKFEYIKNKLGDLDRMPVNQPQINVNPKQQGGPVSFKWDPNKAGKGMHIMNANTTVVLKESPYIFRSVISDTPFTSGVHYWEIHAMDFTENEMKLGVTIRPDFNLNSAFCDYDTGFAYYGLGQVRNGSNAQGQQYGKKFKNQGKLGIYLNMNKGTLAFAINDEYAGVAFTNQKLKQGPIYAAASLLHFAGCTLVCPRQIPKYFE